MLENTKEAIEHGQSRETGNIDRAAKRILFRVPGQKETLSSSSSPNNDTQTKSVTVCHKQGISTTKMN